MIFAKAFTLTLAFYLASSAQAASLQRREYPGEATQCIASIAQQVQSVVTGGDLIKKSADIEAAFVAIKSFVGEKGEYIQSLINTEQSCCPLGATAVEKFSDFEAQTVSNLFSQFSQQFQGNIDYFKIVYHQLKTSQYSAVQGAAIAEALRLLEQAVDSFAFCIISKTPTFADKLELQKSEIDNTFKINEPTKILDNIFLNGGAKGETDGSTSPSTKNNEIPTSFFYSDDSTSPSTTNTEILTSFVYSDDPAVYDTQSKNYLKV